MKNLIKNAILTTATAALLFNAGVANAKIKEVKFHIVQGEFENLPTMEMRFENGKWNWVNKSKTFNTRIKVYFKASGKVNSAHVTLTDSGVSLWALPAGYETNKYEKLSTVGISKATLAPFEGKASALCDVFGGDKKTIRDMNVNAQMAVGQNGNVVRKNGSFPIKVVCQAKPNNPQRTPVDLKIAQMKLYTVPAQPVCGKPVMLITEIWTNKPGKVPFILERNDGATQKASVTTTSTGNGFVKRWSKTYNFDKSVDRRYRVVAQKEATSSNWTDLKVSCGASADTGRPKKLPN